MATTQQSFDIDDAMTRIESAVAPFPKAAMFELREAGYTSTFEQLIACMLSIRTRDETSVLAAPRLFAIARTPAEVAALPIARIAAAIADVAFAPRKAEQIQAIAIRTRDEFGGDLPCEDEVLQSLPGVGTKCAHLVLGVACGVPEISVDVHVHRVTNRWGYVLATTPERTMVALQQVLPKRYWIDINRLLVPFGKHICTGTRPHCSTCPVADMCAQIGVINPR